MEQENVALSVLIAQGKWNINICMVMFEIDASYICICSMSGPVSVTESLKLCPNV